MIRHKEETGSDVPHYGEKEESNVTIRGTFVIDTKVSPVMTGITESAPADLVSRLSLENEFFAAV